MRDVYERGHRERQVCRSKKADFDWFNKGPQKCCRSLTVIDAFPRSGILDDATKDSRPCDMILSKQVSIIKLMVTYKVYVWPIKSNYVSDYLY